MEDNHQFEKLGDGEVEEEAEDQELNSRDSKPQAQQERTAFSNIKKILLITFFVMFFLLLMLNIYFWKESRLQVPKKHPEVESEKTSAEQQRVKA